MHNYDLEREADRFGLTELDEEEEEDGGSGDSGRKRTSFDKGLANGSSLQKPKRSKTIEFDNLTSKTSLDGRRRHGS